MTKKIVIAFVVAVAMTGRSFPQETVKKDSVPTEKIARNEIGVNLIPLSTFLTGADLFEKRFSISYKRPLKKQMAIRIAWSYTVKKPYTGTYSVSGVNDIVFTDEFLIVAQTDSTQTRRADGYSSKNNIQLNTGLEWRLGKRKIKHFLGGDLTSGYYRSKHESWDFYLSKEEYSYGSLVACSGNCGPYIMATTQEPSLNSRDGADMFYAGIHPFYGISIPLTKRFSFSVQTGCDLAFGFGNGTHEDYLNNEFYNTKSTVFGFEFGSIVNDFSLVYRF